MNLYLYKTQIMEKKLLHSLQVHPVGTQQRIFFLKSEKDLATFIVSGTKSQGKSLREN